MQKQENKVQNFQQALQLLLDAVNLAQKRGAFNLQESSLIYESIVKIQETYKPKPLDNIEEEKEKIEEI